MNVIFTGVGEAFDEALGNTSLLVLFETKEVKRQVLLDCGFTAAHASPSAPRLRLYGGSCLLA
jgi:hypothetical protein